MANGQFPNEGDLDNPAFDQALTSGIPVQQAPMPVPPAPVISEQPMLQDVALASPVPENLSPASINPPPVDPAAAMVQQAVEAPTYDYSPDKQGRFNALVEQYKKLTPTSYDAATGAPLFELKPMQEAAEDMALAQMLREDAAIEQSKLDIAAETEARTARQRQRDALAGKAGVVLPSQLAQQAEQEVKDALQTPSEPEVLSAELEIRDQVAQQAGAQRVMAAQQLKDAEVASKVATEAQKNVEEAEFASLPELFAKGNLGQKIGAALAIMAGAWSQGLMQAKENPVMRYLETNFDQVIKKRKMAADKEAAIQEAFYKDARLKLDQQAQKLQGRLTDAQIAKIYGEIDDKINEARLKQETALKLKYGQITDPRDFGKEADKAIRLPDGTYRLAKNKSAANKLDTYRNEVEPAVAGLQRVLQLTKEGMPVDLRKRAQVEGELAAIVGSLRLPITGPGVLTDAERSMLQEIIGNPNKIFALSVIEHAKLRTVRNKLQSDLKQQFFNAGVDIPSTRQEEAVKYLMQQGLTKEKAEQLIEKRMAQ